MGSTSVVRQGSHKTTPETFRRTIWAVHGRDPRPDFHSWKGVFPAEGDPPEWLQRRVLRKGFPRHQCANENHLTPKQQPPKHLQTPHTHTHTLTQNPQNVGPIFHQSQRIGKCRTWPKQHWPKYCWLEWKLARTGLAQIERSLLKTAVSNFFGCALFGTVDRVVGHPRPIGVRWVSLPGPTGDLNGQGGIKAKRQPFLWLWSVVLSMSCGGLPNKVNVSSLQCLCSHFVSNNSSFLVIGM